MKIRILITSILFLVSATFAVGSDIDILKNRLIHDAVDDLGFTSRTVSYEVSDFSKAGQYLSTMRTDGRWPDIDYQDRDNMWSPLKHLNRQIVMTIKYSQEKSALYHDRVLLAAIEKSIEYWYKVNPKCKNWYKNDIAKQFYLNVIGLLLQDKINNTLHKKIVDDLTGKLKKTGSNRTLLSWSMIYRGVLENDIDRINAGVKGVTDQVVITTKEGIQRDYSFHQHGSFLYNGNYGFNFLRESIWLAAMVRGTRFAYSDEKIAILRDYYLEGMRWMLRNETIDNNCRGRTVGRTHGFPLKGIEYVRLLDQFMVADPDHAEAYRISKEHIENQTPQAISGSKHFWRSDYTVHHRPGFFTSVKMCSARTVGIELDVNSENLLGYWLPYGLTYLYKDGREFFNIFPVWDWARLPGVTNPYIELAKKGRQTQTTTFVGGVTNGTYGVSAMDFFKEDTRAKKAWFWFDDEWVALGAGIESTHASNIVTGVSQTLLRGDVVVDGQPFSKGEKTLTNPSWVLHDHVGYIFPGRESVIIKAQAQSQNLQRIYGLGKDTVYTMDVFSLWFDHGNKPTGASYEYIVVPVTDAMSVASYAKAMPIKILSNTREIQAVSHNLLKLTGVVFHQAGELPIGANITISVDQPAIVLVDSDKGTISISDPAGLLAHISMTVTKAGVQSKTECITLPTGEYAGQSVQVTGLITPQRN